MNNFNPLNASKLARETFAAALDAELQRLTGFGVQRYCTTLEIHRLFNHAQILNGSPQQSAKTQALAITEKRAFIA